MQELTKAQEEILKVLWELEEGVIMDILNKLPEPKPAYNTVSTVVKVLEKKQYVSHRSYGKTYVYFPLIDRKKYAQHILKDSLKSFFNGSVKQAVSFFVQNKDASLSELEEIRQLIEEKIRIQKLKQ